jgi:hypothetical protein
VEQRDDRQEPMRLWKVTCTYRRIHTALEIAVREKPAFGSPLVPLVYIRTARSSARVEGRGRLMLPVSLAVAVAAGQGG